jgi:CHAD domain-containing protein
VLPQPAVEQLVCDLKWLGSSTNRLRDLDVFLDELADYRGQIGSDASLLDPVEGLIRRDRRAALRRVRSALRTRRFEHLIAQWSDVVEREVEEPESLNAARPIAEVAGAKISKAYHRMVRRGSNFDDPPPPDAMHRLRIDGKKLRYLLEFFSSLYPPEVIQTAVKELKAFQDLLGGFNDVEVQRAHLTATAEQVVADGDGHAMTLLALGRLTSIMDERQLEYRRDFRQRFEDFSSTKNRKLYASTFGGD